MSSFSITTTSKAVTNLLKTLANRARSPGPVLEVIGTGIVERTKRRFDTSTGPDGQAWLPNAESTIGMLAARLGASHRKKDGELNAKGARVVANKKPLIGESGDLRRQIVSAVTGGALTVTETPEYAAIQQFGGKAGRGLKVTIPARPSLPIHQDGSLYPTDQAIIMQQLTDFMTEGFD